MAQHHWDSEDANMGSQVLPPIGQAIPEINDYFSDAVTYSQHLSHSPVGPAIHSTPLSINSPLRKQLGPYPPHGTGAGLRALARVRPEDEQRLSSSPRSSYIDDSDDRKGRAQDMATAKPYAAFPSPNAREMPPALSREYDAMRPSLPSIADMDPPPMTRSSTAASSSSAYSHHSRGPVPASPYGTLPLPDRTAAPRLPELTAYPPARPNGYPASLTPPYMLPPSQPSTSDRSPFSLGPPPPHSLTWEMSDLNNQPRKRRRGNLPKWITDRLREWFAQHINHPYPNEEEKQNLMMETGLTISQASGSPSLRHFSIQEMQEIAKTKTHRILEISLLTPPCNPTDQQLVHQR
ncbi:MAG: hypothetical protein M1829_001604 [Trizodia sp. TS-e1964]|nr:MAG: hypothetical protein M1829_001604 [Trizodia sp. TS-e1964]